MGLRYKPAVRRAFSTFIEAMLLQAQLALLDRSTI